ncbi:MAG: hypothetical protein JW927_11290 [Deltaproteobacteria bacterium]|nr:hypothetical protein [Deltaproteobacteria bacterium]
MIKNRLKYLIIKFFTASILLFNFFPYFLYANNDKGEGNDNLDVIHSKSMVRDFVLYNYIHIAEDILNGKGIYIETLFHLLHVNPEEREAYLTFFLKNLLDKERIPDFSNCIAAYYKR